MPVTKRQFMALAEIHYDLFDQPSNITEIKPEQPELPSVAELYDLFEKFNWEYFDGKLPITKISYSQRMLIAGSYTPSKRQIKIGIKYHEIFPDEIEDTLKHEMIHVLYPNHDKNFKSWAGRIGASLKAKSHPLLRGNYKYLYVCPSCGKEYPRRKRLRMASCGTCTPGKHFDKRFKLRLIKKKS